jgi:hypothetical protein
LNILNDSVDFFFIVESTKTFTGNPKILYYEENKERFKKFHHKIKHYIVTDCPDSFEEVINRLLTEIYPNNSKIKYAYWMMCSMETESQMRYKVSAKSYEYAKQLISTRTVETKQKISKSLKQSYDSGKRKKWNLGKKMPKEYGEKISKAKKGMVGTNKGIQMSEEQKEKIRNTLLGHEVDQNTRNKISQTLLNKPILICPHCDKSSRGTSFKIYHFEHCKFKK